MEWKYTEAYRKVRAPQLAKDRVRAERYQAAFDAPEGPLRSDLLPFDLMLDEPFYQLMRQQLLAHQLETVRAEGADIVRVLHVLPPDNRDYQQSLTRPEHHELADTVDAVWSRLLHCPDRFIHIDPAVFLDTSVTCSEYVARYDDGDR